MAQVSISGRSLRIANGIYVHLGSLCPQRYPIPLAMGSNRRRGPLALDEADTFLHWIAPGEPSHWFPHSNNHVLNSLLIRFFVWLFGLSPMALRAPALIGGALYIAASYRLCNLVARAGFLRVAAFVSCVYTPFIMDYLVAARGYGLTLGFLVMGLFWFSRRVLLEEDGGEHKI